MEIILVYYNVGKRKEGELWGCIISFMRWEIELPFLHNVYIIIGYSKNINCWGGVAMMGLSLAQCIHAYTAKYKESSKLYFNGFRYVNKTFSRIKTCVKS